MLRGPLQLQPGVTGESLAGIGVYGISSTGYAGYFAGKVYTTQWYELTEISTPAAPIANRARLFSKDNGVGTVLQRSPYRPGGSACAAYTLL